MLKSQKIYLTKKWIQNNQNHDQYIQSYRKFMNKQTCSAADTRNNPIFAK
jgi:hypothetical protein